MRARCCVPGCRRTGKLKEDEAEWMCTPHYNSASEATLVEYEEAWKQADKADQRAADGLEVPDSVYVRVNAAWERLQAEVFEAARAG